MSPRSVALFQQWHRWTSPVSPDAELLGRWVRGRDEEAFAALVARHGPMVLGLCRRVLGNSHDAEDAFQAVFLILARKAGSLRHPEALAGWLNGVAVRLASKARAAPRRRSSDALPAALEPQDTHPEPLDLLSARELLALLDQEIARLPEVYRLPLVLCDLEDRTHEEAARLLGWTCGSLRGRLLRGRARLRSRLARRGLAPAALLAGGLTRMTATAAVPPELAASVSRLAASSSPMSPTVAALMKEGMHGLMGAKRKLLSALLLAVGVMAAGAGMLAHSGRTPQAAEKRPETPALPAQAAKKPDLRRDQLGDPLPADAVARLGTLRFRHGGVIQDLYFGPDGKTLVSCGGWDGLRFWDAGTGREIQRFAGQERAVHAALSPDNKRLAVTIRTNNPTDEPVEIRDFATGALLHRCGRVGGGSPRLLFSPNSKTLATFSWQPQIDLFDPLRGEHLRTLEGHTGIVWSLAFSADGKTLISAGDDRTIRFWDVGTGRQTRQIKHENRIGDIALSPDGKLLALIDTIKQEYPGGASWHADRRVRLWDAATGAELRQLTMPDQQILPDVSAGFRSLCFAPDGKTLLTGGLDGVLRIWDPATGRELKHFAGFAGSPVALTFAPDGKSIALVDGSSTIRRIRLEDGEDVKTWPGHHSAVSSLALTPDGQSIVTAGYDGTLRFWEPATGRELRRRAAALDFNKGSLLLADASGYFTMGPDHLVRVHDLASGEQRAILRGHDGRFLFALSPDHKLLASATADNVIRLLDPDTGEVRRTLTKANGYVQGMSFSSDGRILVVPVVDGTVTVWDAATGERRREFTAVNGRTPPGASYMSYTTALSPDGRLLAFGLQGRKSGNLPVVKTSTGEEVIRFITEDGACQMTFSPDGKSLAWAGWREGTVYLGEIATGGVRKRFSGHRGRVVSLAFSPDGKTLISGSEDTTALVWDLTGRFEPKGRLTDDDLKRAWDTLAQHDAAAGYRAIQALAADPERSIPFLRTRLKPAPAVPEEHLKRWIAQLGSDQFAQREKAARELEKQGEAALHSLRQALEERPALEIRRRLEQIIEKAERGEWTPSPEQLRIRRALGVLERAGTPEARRVLETLAEGAPGAWLTLDAKAALTRLAKR
jgi:RNA polymerase sigma factor (sigma-70 family)